MDDLKDTINILKYVIVDFIKEFPIIFIGIFFIIISVVELDVRWSPITLFNYSTFSFSQLSTFILGAFLFISGTRKSFLNYNAWQLGIKKVKLRQISMQSIYDKLHKKSAYKATELKYMGTGLRSLFSPRDTLEPRYNFKEIIEKNKNLSSMMVLLLNPKPPQGEQQQLKEVEAMQQKYEESRKLSEDIPKTLDALGRIYWGLADNLKNKLQVKVSIELFYNQFNMADDEMIVTHYCCGGRADESPVYYLKRTKTKDGLFERHLEDFKLMWRDASEVQFENTGKWNVITKL